MLIHLDRVGSQPNLLAAPAIAACSRPDLARRIRPASHLSQIVNGRSFTRQREWHGSPIRQSEHIPITAVDDRASIDARGPAFPVATPLPRNGIIAICRI